MSLYFEKIKGMAEGEIGFRCRCYDAVTSTNDVASELVNKGAVHGEVLVADSQTSGRGRMGRKWVSPGGVNLYLSVVLRPTIKLASAPKITLVAGIAVAEAIAGFTNSVPKLKWPNDILLDGKKVCGILSETAGSDALIMGIGINVNMSEDDIPEELKDIAISLKIVEGHEFDRGVVLAEVCKGFERWYKIFSNVGFDVVRKRYLELSAIHGHMVEVSFQDEIVRGVADGIGEDGCLILKTEKGKEKIVAGDVNLKD